MNAKQIIRAVIPGAPEDLCEHILWACTPFPCGAITAQSLYKAASRFKRAQDNGIRLCDLCGREVKQHKSWTCESCHAALERAWRGREAA